MSLAFAVAAIALPDSLNPSLIIAAVLLTLGPRPLRRTIAFTVSAFAVTLAGGLVVALGLGNPILSLLPKLSRSIKYEVMAAFGVALVCGGVVIWRRCASLADSEPPSSRQPTAANASGGSGSAVLMGAGIAGVESFTAFPYFAAIAMVVGSSVSLSGKVVPLVLYNAVYVLPLILIVSVCPGWAIAPGGCWRRSATGSRSAGRSSSRRSSPRSVLG